MSGSKLPISKYSTVVATGNQLSADLTDGVVILHLESGVYFGLDAVGSRIWTLIQKPRPVQEILDALLEEYDVSPERCERDLLALLDQLDAHELVETRDGFSS